MITEEDKDEFIGQMRGLAFTEDGRYETKAKELLNELIDEPKGQTLHIDGVIVKLVCECTPLESQFMIDGLETDWCLTCGGKAN